MSAILTVSDLAVSAWIDAIYLAIRSIALPAKITATDRARLVQIATKLSTLALHPKMLDTGYAIDK